MSLKAHSFKKTLLEAAVDRIKSYAPYITDTKEHSKCMYSQVGCLLRWYLAEQKEKIFFYYSESPHCSHVNLHSPVAKVGERKRLTKCLIVKQRRREVVGGGEGLNGEKESLRRGGKEKGQ
jgi:hypothetical protein